MLALSYKIELAWAAVAEGTLSTLSGFSESVDHVHLLDSPETPFSRAHEPEYLGIMTLDHMPHSNAIMS